METKLLEGAELNSRQKEEGRREDTREPTEGIKKIERRKELCVRVCKCVREREKEKEM
jgi:hypothetical protein